MHTMGEPKYEAICEVTMNVKLTLSFAIALPMVVFAPVAARAQFPFGGPEQPMLSRFDRDGGGFYRSYGSGRPGPALSPADVKSVPASVPFYDLGTLRTLFFQFEDNNWEKEMMAFKQTDIEVPATLVMDGKTYKEVGVSF